MLPEAACRRGWQQQRGEIGSAGEPGPHRVASACSVPGLLAQGCTSASREHTAGQVPTERTGAPGAWNPSAICA